MRVVVDDSAAFNQGAGIGRYARQVVPAAARCLPGARFRLVYAPSRSGIAPYGEATMQAFDPGQKVTIRRLPFSRRRADQLWFRAGLPVPLQLFAGSTDLVYSPDFTAPPAGRTPRLITIHDLAYLVAPAHAPERLRRYLAQVVPRQVSSAARVLTVSQTTRDDLIERYNVDAQRIAVVPNGVEERFFTAEPPTEQLRRKLSLPDAYLLSVGTIEPRKNLVSLFAALRMLGSRLDLPLLVVGARGWDANPIYGAARDLEERGIVRFLGPVSDDVLPSVYAGAAALVYPSWYEGFGLPVLEALAAGIPVIASTAPALREVAASEAVFVDPADVEALAAEIERTTTSELQSAVARTVRRGRAALFRWEDAGEALAAVMREVTGELGKR